MNIETLTGPELLDLFNKLVALDERGRKIKSFKSREAGRRRITHFLLKMDKHVDDIEDLLNGVPTKKTQKREKKPPRYTDDMKIVILKTERQRRTTGAEKRFLELMKIANKTVGNFLKVVGNRLGQGDLKYWSDKGRIKVE